MPVSSERVIDYLKDRAGRPLKAKELARALDVPARDHDEFRALLDRLEADGAIYRVRRQRYAVPERINLVAGRLQTIRSGAGFVIPEDGNGDLFIPAEGLESAVDGDRVVARIERRRGARRAEGRVIRVLERGRSSVVGVYHPAKTYGFVVPEDPKLSRDIFVPPEQEGGAQEGDVVVVRVVSWGDGHLGPAGEVERVLGPIGAPGVDVLAVVYGHELPLDFPPEIQEEADALRERGIAPRDTEHRDDLRESAVLAIDPADARDHDDALSIAPAGEGLWEVGIHIADVAHYVVEGGALDAEALRRGTSTYLVDRVIPMLPEALSADLCSLQPGKDRLAVSLFVTLDEAGRVQRHRLARSVVRIRHALSYDEAQAVLDGEASLDPPTDEALRQLARLCRVLRESRRRRGSLDFDLPEARVVLNTRGEPTDIQRVLRLESHRLIEDFMILANEVVAREALRRRIPFLYRIHEAPDASRMDQLREFVAKLGFRIGGGAEPGPRDFQKLLEQVKGHAAENLVSTIVLRSLKQARYSAENLGHFGLASRNYTHFTSPIRRYPDLVVQRLALRGWAAGETIPAELAEDALPGVARLASERERVAVDAERDSVDLKKVEFMERHLGDEFDGTISGVTAFGFFVLLDEFFVEGLVHVSSLEDDYYLFLEDRFALQGERTRRRFRLGDRVRVGVASVNRESRKIDFLLVEGKGVEV